MEYPYNDETMFYDYTTHRYILTPACVLNELNTNLAERLNKRGSAVAENVPSDVLRRISNIIYSEIYKRSEYNDVQEYLLAKCPSLRQIVKDAMKAQVLYFLINGDTSNFAGIDLKNGRIIDIDRLRNQSRLAPDAEIELQKPIRELGDGKVSILYQGGWNVFKCFDYEADKY